MDATEVIPAIPERSSGPMVFPFLTEAVRQSGKPSETHAKRQVAALHYRSANAIRVRLTHNWDYLHGLDFGGAVAAFAFAGGAINLDELCEVAAVAKRVGNRGTVRLKAVRGDLEARPCGSVPKALDKDIRRLLIAFAHRDVEHQLGMPLDGNEGVAVPEVLIVLRPDTLFFFPDIGPNFICFHVAYFDVADLVCHDSLAFLTGQGEQLQDRGVVNVRGAFDAGYTVAFQQKPQNHLGLLYGQVHAVQWLVARLQEGFRALAALESLRTLSVASLAFAFDPAGMTGHGNPLEIRNQKPDNEFADSFGFGCTIYKPWSVLKHWLGLFAS